jgi:trimeric autotransporter adhesin
VKTYSGDGGQATSATLCNPFDVIVDASGNLYIADNFNNCIRMVSKSSGVITTVAGIGMAGYYGDGGEATSATLHSPGGITLDKSGNLYIADILNHRIRMVAKSSGVITTVAGTQYNGYRGDGGQATSAELQNPEGIAVDASGNIYIADTKNNRIRMVSESSGIITTVAGTGLGAYNGDGGPATSATLSNPRGIAVDASGNIYIADVNNNRIRMVSKSSRMMTTVAGNGTCGYSGDGELATSATLSSPQSVVLDPSGNLYIADVNNNRIRMVSKSSGIITTVAGTGTYGHSGDGGLATSATLYFPTGVTVDASGNLYIADSYNNRIRMVSLPATPSASPSLSSTASISPSLQPSLPLSLPLSMSISPSSSSSLDSTYISRSSVITTVAGSGINGYRGDGGQATSATLFDPIGVTVDALGNIYIADYSNKRIRMVSKISGIITTIAGTGGIGDGGDGGQATSATLSNPCSVTVDASGNLYIADTLNDGIRLVSKSSGIITTVAGTVIPSLERSTRFLLEEDVAHRNSIVVDASGNLYIADHNRIRMVSKNSRMMTTVAGSDGDCGYSGDGGLATSATLYHPRGIALDASDNLYIADSFNNRIRMVSKSSGIITTVAGAGTYGYSGNGGQATSATLNFPCGISVDASGNIYIADVFNHCIRMVSMSSGIITTVAGTGKSGYSGDGGLATSATLYLPFDVTVDASGHLYIADSYNNRIRMVSLPATPSASPSLSSTASISPSLQPSLPLSLPLSMSISPSSSSSLDSTYISRSSVITIVAGSGAIVIIILLILLTVRIQNRSVTYSALRSSPTSEGYSLEN